jgi:hypothetical protein
MDADWLINFYIEMDELMESVVDKIQDIVIDRLLLYKFNRYSEEEQVLFEDFLENELFFNWESQNSNNC